MSSQTPTPTPPPDRREHIGDYIKNHTRETVAYVLLILGIVLLFFEALWGGILIGLVTGIYFGDEIVDYLVHWKGNLDSHGVARNLILTGVIIAFLISAPAIFLGIAVAIGIKQLFVTKT